MPKNKIDKCPICSLPTIYLQRDISTKKEYINIICYKCGKYKIDELIPDIGMIEKYTERQKTNISGWLRENQNRFINRKLLEDLEKLKPPPIGERATKLLLYISGILPSIENTIEKRLIYDNYECLKSPYFPKVSGFKDEIAKRYIPLFSISWSKTWSELLYLLEDYLDKEKKYLDSSNGYILIKPKGWSFLDSYDQGKDSQMAFIALKYVKDLLEYVPKWISGGIEDAGYKPIIMRDHPHINIIDNEMIAMIKRSKFSVVDLTYNSRGAYYESGFTHGLGRPVIFTCEKKFFHTKEKKKRIHFDTNHYPVIEWEWGDEGGQRIRRELKNLIEASPIGKGDYRPSE